MTTQKRFVSWAAVSTREQVEKVSLSDQARVNKEHVAKHDGLLIAELVVAGESRNIILFEDAARKIEAYARLKDLIDRRAFDVLVYLDSSRLGRTHSLLAAISALCEQAGILLYETSSPPANLDGPIGTFDGQLLRAIHGVTAQRENTKLRERRRMGMRARVQNGQSPGRLAYGYRRAFDTDGKERVEIDPVQGEAVQLVFELYLNQGRTQADIALELHRRGYVPPRSKQWNDTAIQVFIKNVWRYAGYVEYRPRGESFKVRAQWEPLISDKMAEAILAEQAARARPRKFVGSPRLFSRCLECGGCHGTIQQHSPRLKSYHCRHGCKGSWIRDQSIVPAIRQAILDLADEEEFARAADLLPDDQHLHQHKRLAQIDEEGVAIAGQRRQLTIAFSKSVLKLDEYESVMAELAATLDDLEIEQEDIQRQLAVVDTKADRLLRLQEVRNDGLRYLEEANMQIANSWMRRHFRIHVHDNRVVRVEYL